MTRCGAEALAKVTHWQDEKPHAFYDGQDQEAQRGSMGIMTRLYMALNFKCSKSQDPL